MHMFFTLNRRSFLKKKNFFAQKVSNIHLVTKDFEIVPLTNLLKLLLPGRIVGGGCLSC